MGWTCIQERSEQRVELSILVLFTVTIFLTLSDFQLRALLKRRATMETKQWCSCIKVRVETVLSKSDLVRNREKYDPGRKPGEGNEIGSLPRKSGGLASMVVVQVPLNCTE